MAKNSGGTRTQNSSNVAQGRTLMNKAFSSFSPEIRNEISNYQGLSDGYKEMISKDLKPFDNQFKKLQAQMDKLQSQYDDGDLSDSKFEQAYSKIEKEMDKVKLHLRSKIANSGIKKSALEMKGNIGFLPNG